MLVPTYTKGVWEQYAQLAILEIFPNLSDSVSVHGSGWLMVGLDLRGLSQT